MAERISLFQKNSVIAAVRDIKLIEKAASSPVQSIFLMTGDIFTIDQCVVTAKAYKKSIYLHVDLIRGVANDKEGIKYLAQKVKPDGIVSTKNQLIQTAKKEGLFAVQHLFLLDTLAYETGIRNILDVKPDAVEIMPGLMPRVIREMSRVLKCPIIAAGLIKSREEALQAVNAGARAVAIGDAEHWTLNLAEQ